MPTQPDIPTTRDQLVRAAQDAIRELGLPAVTVREITRRASANLASIPYYFGSKDALVAEALITEVRMLVEPVLALLATDRPPAERATEAVAVLNGLFERSRTQVPVYLAALAASPHDGQVQAALGDLWADLRRRLAVDIVRQLEAGQLPSWVAPEPMASLILSLVNGVVIASVTDPDGPSHHDVAAQFLSLLLAAGSLAGDKPSSQDGER